MTIDRILKQFKKMSRQLDDHAKYQEFLVAGLEEDIQRCKSSQASAKAEGDRARSIKNKIDSLIQ